MNVSKILLATSALVMTAKAASAQIVDDRGAYVNIGVSAVEFDAYTLTGRVGYDINRIFAVEGEGSFGIIDDEDEEFGVDVDTGIDYSLGAFGVLKAPLNETTSLFARGGYHFTQLGIETESGGLDSDIEIDTDGFAVGAGAQFMLGQDRLNGIRIEYTYYDGGDDADVEFDDGTEGEIETDGGLDVFSVAYVRKF